MDDGKLDVDPPQVGAPDHLGQVLENDGQPGQGQELGERIGLGPEKRVDHQPLQGDAHEAHERQGDDAGQKNRQAQGNGEGVNEVKPEHDALAVGHVDDLDDPEDQVHAEGQESQDPAQENTVQRCVEE